MAAPARKYLSFEIEARPLDEEIARLLPGSQEHAAIRARLEKLLKSRTAKLSAWEHVQLARHPDRPYSLDLAGRLFSDFEPLAGDRLFGEDPALVGGLARFGGAPVCLLAQQKGRTAEERSHRNFGMVRPEGYRKAQRLLGLAGRFGLPVICFVDTPGAFPGVEAEERGQAQAIAETLIALLEVPVPTVSLVLGEGGSGGALALAVTDRVLMAEHAVYSVISPEGCAAILWEDSKQAPAAAEALHCDARSLLKLGIIDQAVSEPAGGAHRDVDAFAKSCGQAISAQLKDLGKLSVEKLLAHRRDRYRQMTATAVRGAGGRA